MNVLFTAAFLPWIRECLENSQHYAAPVSLVKQKRDGVPEIEVPVDPETLLPGGEDLPC